MIEQRALQRQVGLSLANGYIAGGTHQPSQVGFGLRLVKTVGRSQLALGQMTQAPIVALSQLGPAALLLAGIALGLEPRLGFMHPCLSIILTQAHQDLALLDLLTFIDQQLADLTT
ncbi:hypothetical protein D9M68_717360 [compost metagenome]